LKKGGDFVSKGTLVQDAPGASWDFEAESPRSLSSQLHPADLPRDYGMAGAVGAYEVRELSGALERSMGELESLLHAADSAETLVVEALDRLMPAANRHLLAVEAVEDGVITLSMARKSDRFLFNRTIVPKLKTALAPKLGAVRIQLTDRMR
jgi:hypothetical protein